MRTVLTVVAGLVLALAAAAGVVVSQSDEPSGTPDTSIRLTDGSTADLGAVYDVGQ